jgi:hypothetical protein
LSHIDEPCLQRVGSVGGGEKLNFAALRTNVELKLLPFDKEFKQISEHPGTCSFMKLIFPGKQHLNITPQAVDLPAAGNHILYFYDLFFGEAVITVPAQFEMIFHFRITDWACFHISIFIKDKVIINRRKSKQPPQIKLRRLKKSCRFKSEYPYCGP